MSIPVNHGGVIKLASPRCRTGAGVVTPLSVWANHNGVVKKVWPNGPTGGTIGGSWGYDNQFGEYRAIVVVNVFGGRAPYQYEFGGDAEFFRFGPQPNQAEARSFSNAPVNITCLVTDADGLSKLLTGQITG